MKERRKPEYPEYPEKTPVDELQKMPYTKASLCSRTPYTLGQPGGCWRELLFVG